jgi:hypothetical protein
VTDKEEKREFTLAVSAAVAGCGKKDSRGHSDRIANHERALGIWVPVFD